MKQDPRSRTAGESPETERGLAREVREALGRLVHRVLETRPGGHLLLREPEEIVLRLPLPLAGAEGRADEERLLKEVHRLVDEEIERLASFRPGRVACLRCRGQDCDHGLPPDSRAVFLGWSATGTPRWIDFAQLCLDRRHPRVDLLYAETPGVAYQMMDGEELALDLIGSVRRRVSSQVLAQAALGFFPVSRRDPRRELRALTAQAVLVRGRRRPPRLFLNLVAGGAASAEEQPPWLAAARAAQGKLDTLARRARGPAGRRGRGVGLPLDHLRRAATAILGDLARRVARRERGRSRRTLHAQERHESGRRPTRTALLDLRRASPETLLVDDRSGALVVIGGRGRTHFFSREGRLVSSVRYAQDEVEKKRKLGLWRAATAEEAECLRRIAAGAGDEEA